MIRARRPCLSFFFPFSSIIQRVVYIDNVKKYFEGESQEYVPGETNSFDGSWMEVGFNNNSNLFIYVYND